MNEQKQPAENSKENLAIGQQVVADSGNPCRDACDEILNRINGPGIPITINSTQVTENSSNIEITKIRNFINDSRIVFRDYKRLMDDILNCNLGKADTYFQKTTLSATHSAADNKIPDCGEGDVTTDGNLLSSNENNLFRTGSLFSSSKSYSILKYATEKFINKFLGLDNAGIPPDLVPLPYVKLIEDRISDICCCPCPIKFRPLFVELIWN